MSQFGVSLGGLCVLDQYVPPRGRGAGLGCRSIPAAVAAVASGRKENVIVEQPAGAAANAIITRQSATARKILLDLLFHCAPLGCGSPEHTAAA